MKIYFVNDIDTFDEDFIEKCADFFPEWRKEKMLSYRHFKGKIQNALAYILLVHALKEEGILDEMPEFSYNEHGKPFLKNYPGWHFNLSHCKTAVCCILSREEIGIDIEEIGEYKERLAEYICNEEELNRLKESDNKAEDFYRLWTRKESVFKMLGSGITNEIKDILCKTGYDLESYRIGNKWISVSRKSLRLSK